MSWGVDVTQAFKIIREIGLMHSRRGNVATTLPISGTVFLYSQTNEDIRYLLTERKRLLW